MFQAIVLRSLKALENILNDSLVEAHFFKPQHYRAMNILSNSIKPSCFFLFFSFFLFLFVVTQSLNTYVASLQSYHYTPSVCLLHCIRPKQNI
jgi:hypothetical protein